MDDDDLPSLVTDLTVAGGVVLHEQGVAAA
jgi:hypothetical protein